MTSANSVRSFVLSAFFVALGAALASPAVQAATFDVDPSHSSVGFTIKHMVGKVNGTFSDYSASFEFDEKNPEKSSGTFTIKAASINTANEKRDEHLRTADFLDVKTYPEITFKSTKFAKAGKNKYKLTGDFTMHGVTKKDVVFDVEYGGQTKDPWGNQRAGFEAISKIKRKDFNIVWNKLLDSGDMMLGDEVQLKLQIEAVQKADKKSAEKTEKK